MKLRVFFVSLLLVYGAMILPFSKHMSNRPIEVKLGYLPHPQLLKVLSLDHDLLVAEMAVVKVLFYYGSIVGHFLDNVIIRPEHANMYRTLQTATQLDPYNMDAYYFAQAAFTWDLGRIREVNALLERGAKFRSWDPWINFYLGFNYFYFLKDYNQASGYLQRAGELAPRNILFSKLAARFYYESDQTESAVIFLEAMIAQAKDAAVKETYRIRRDALLAVLEIENAKRAFIAEVGRDPEVIGELVAKGYLPQVPLDPYGGTFYLDAENRVRSTSQFANPDL